MVADHHRHRHRLSQRTPQAQNHRTHNPDTSISQHAGPNHLPPRCPQRQHRLSLRGRHRQHDVAGNRRDDRKNHDRQNDARRQQSHPKVRPFKEVGPAEVLVEQRPQRVAHQRHQHKHAPQPIYNTGNRRQQFGNKRDRRPELRRTKLAQKDRNAKRQRHCHSQRQKRRLQRAHNEGPSAKVARHRIPPRMHEKLEAKLMQAQLRLYGQNRQNKKDDAEDAQSTQQHQADEEPVSGPATPPRLQKLANRRRRALRCCRLGRRNKVRDRRRHRRFGRVRFSLSHHARRSHVPFPMPVQMPTPACQALGDCKPDSRSIPIQSKTTVWKRLTTPRGLQDAGRAVPTGYLTVVIVFLTIA